jgi:Lon protease-like protein
MTGPFVTNFADLPETLPIFPLRGVILLPRGRLPLNIFEPRYIDLIGDSLAQGRLLGIIQPIEDESNANPMPQLFRTGCVGRISSFAETDDGRMSVVVNGISRFVVHEELLPRKSYRRVRAIYEPFRNDFDDRPPVFELDRKRLQQAFERCAPLFNLNIPRKNLDELSDRSLIITLSLIAPFEPREKQALLETPSEQERADLLTTLLEMAALADRRGVRPTRQ